MNTDVDAPKGGFGAGYTDRLSLCTVFIGVPYGSRLRASTISKTRFLP